MPREEREQARVVLAAVLLAIEAVALGRVVERFHRHVGAAQRLLHHLGVLRRSALVLAACGQKHGGADAPGQPRRRDRGHRFRRTEPLAQVGLAGSAALDVAVAVHGRQVVHAHVAGGARVQVGLLRHAHQRRVAAVARAVDADPCRIRMALRDGPAGGVGEIVLHAPAPLARAGGTERLAVAGGTAEVHLQHRIAGRGQHLHVVVEPPHVLHAERPAMRMDDHRQSALAATRHGEIAVQGRAVAGGDRHRPLFGHGVDVDPFAPADDEIGLLGLGVEEVEVAGVAVAEHFDQRQPAVPRARGHLDRMAGERDLQAALHARFRRVAVDEARVPAAVQEHRADRRAGVGPIQQARRVGDLVPQHRASLARHHVVGDQLVGAVRLLGDEVGGAVVLGEADRNFRKAGAGFVADQLPLLPLRGAVEDAHAPIDADAVGETHHALVVGDEGGVAHRRARHGDAAAGVHVHAVRTAVGVGAERGDRDDDVAVVGRQVVDQLGVDEFLLLADDPRAQTVVLGPIADQQLGRGAVGVHREQLAGQHRPVERAHLLRRRDQQPLRADPDELLHVRMPPEGERTEQLPVAVAQDHQRGAVLERHGRGEVVAGRRDREFLERVLAQEAVDVDRVGGHGGQQAGDQQRNEKRERIGDLPCPGKTTATSPVAVGC